MMLPCWNWMQWQKDDHTKKNIMHACKEEKNYINSSSTATAKQVSRPDSCIPCECTTNRKRTSERERWVIAIAARQIQSTDFQTQKYHALCFHFQELGAQRSTSHAHECLLLRSVCYCSITNQREHAEEASAAAASSKKDEEIERSGNDLWFFTWNKTHTHSKCLFIWCTRETTNRTNIFIRLRIRFFFSSLRATTLKTNWKWKKRRVNRQTLEK